MSEVCSARVGEALAKKTRPFWPPGVVRRLPRPLARVVFTPLAMSLWICANILRRRYVGAPGPRALASLTVAAGLPVIAMSAAPTSEFPSDRRRAHRARGLRQAICLFNGGRPALGVLVRNVTKAGVRITGDELICLPDEFELRIHDGFGQYDSRRVRRIWSKGNAAGLTFLDTVSQG